MPAVRGLGSLAVLAFARPAFGGHVPSYESSGFAFPLPILSSSEVARARSHFQEIEAREPDGRFRVQTLNYHLSDPALWELATHPEILRQAQRFTGTAPEDLRVLATTIFCKYPTTNATAAVVGWHQDLTYWTLHPEKAWTLWMAIDEATSENGALQYAAGMHTGGRLRHIQDRHDKTSALMARQRIADGLVNYDKAIQTELRPGEAVFHHGWTPHFSGPNYSKNRRLAFVVNFIPAATRLLPFHYKDDAEWRKPVMLNDTFPPAVIEFAEQPTIADTLSCAERTTIADAASCAEQ